MNDEWIRIWMEVAMVNYKHDLSTHVERLRKRIYNLSHQMINKPLPQFKSRELLLHEYSQHGSVRLYNDQIKILNNNVSHLAMLRDSVIQVIFVSPHTSIWSKLLWKNM